MALITNLFNCCSAVRYCSLVRFASTVSAAKNADYFHFDPKFSTKEQEKILNTLNSSTAEQLSRYNVSQSRIKSLENWKNKKGPFQSLNEILEVEGLGVKVLEIICLNIINEPTQTDKLKTVGTNSNSNKRNKQVVLPALTADVVAGLNSGVGIHLGPTGISWAKLCKNGNKLEYWSYKNFTSLPPKMLPNDTFQLAVNVLNEIPVGDVYVFEANGNISMQGQNQPSIVSSYVQHLELTSMLLALLNTSPVHNNCLQENQTIDNKVYYLRSKLSARLFKTLVGNERVSASSKISQLLEGEEMPCTPLIVDDKLREHYTTQPPAVKEILGQALMLIVTFMDVCVYKNSTSLQEIKPSRK